MESTQPKVSVCIPTYSHGRYIKECLDSVFAQTMQDFEVIVVDNANADNALDVLAIARQVSGIRPFELRPVRTTYGRCGKRPVEHAQPSFQPSRLIAGSAASTRDAVCAARGVDSAEASRQI